MAGASGGGGGCLDVPGPGLRTHAPCRGFVAKVTGDWSAVLSRQSGRWAPASPPPYPPPPNRPCRARVGAARATVGRRGRVTPVPSRRRAVPARRTLAAPGPRRCPLCRTASPAGQPPSPQPTAIVASCVVARVTLAARCQCATGLSRFPRALRHLHRRRRPPSLTPRRRRHRAAVGWVDQPAPSESCRPVLSTCLVFWRSPASCLVLPRSRREVARTTTTTTTRSSPALCRSAPRAVILHFSAFTHLGASNTTPGVSPCRRCTHRLTRCVACLASLVTRPFLWTAASTAGLRVPLCPGYWLPIPLTPRHHVHVGILFWFWQPRPQVGSTLSS